MSSSRKGSAARSKSRPQDVAPTAPDEDSVQDAPPAAPVADISAQADAENTKRTTRPRGAQSALAAAQERLNVTVTDKRPPRASKQAAPAVAATDAIPDALPPLMHIVVDSALGSVDPEASVTVVDVPPAANTEADADDKLTQAELAAKYNVELTGDPFMDADRVGEARAAAYAALAPKPAKKHRAEGSSNGPRKPRGPNKKDDESVSRLKTMSQIEKKGAAALRVVICYLAREIALRTNRVPQLVADIVSTLTSVIEAANAVSAIPDQPAGDVAAAAVEGDGAAAADVTFIPLPHSDVAGLLSTVVETARKSAEAWAADVDGQIELDDELLRNIGFAAAKAINSLEGFVAPPERDAAAAERSRAARARLIAAAKEREAKAQSKLAQKERDELEKQRQRDREAMQAKAVKGQGIEDTELDHPSEIVGVACAPVPLLSVALFEAALRVWSIASSVPKLVKLTQMPFTTFVLALKDNSTNGTIMRDVIRGFIEASGGGDILDSRASSKSWLGPTLVFMTDRMDAIVAAAAAEVSQAKKKPKPKAPRAIPSTGGRGVRRHHDSDDSDDDSDDSDYEDDEDEDEEGDDEEDDDEEVEEEEAATEEQAPNVDGDATADAPAVSVVRKPRPETPMQAARRQAEEKLVRLRAIVETYSPAKACSWFNLDVAERLQVLKFLADVLLNTKAFADHMADIDQRARVDQAKFEAKVKELRDDAEKAKKALKHQQREAAEVARPKRNAKNGSPLPDAVAEPPALEDDVKPQPPTAGKKGQKSSTPAVPVPPKLLTEEEFAANLTQIDEKCERAIEHAFAALRGKLEEGLRIKLVGRDRYRRLVWYFPQDRRLLVQTVDGVADSANSPPAQSPTSFKPSVGTSVVRVAEWGTPAIAPPSKPTAALIDDEVVEVRRTRGAAREAVRESNDTAEDLGIQLEDALRDKEQTQWSFVAACDLRAFAMSLDERGLREGPLRAAVLQLVPHIVAVDNAVEDVRSNRRRGENFGYTNLKRETRVFW